jgi:TonB family protein
MKRRLVLATLAIAGALLALLLLRPPAEAPDAAGATTARTVPTPVPSVGGGPPAGPSTPASSPPQRGENPPPTTAASDGVTAPADPDPADAAAAAEGGSAEGEARAESVWPASEQGIHGAMKEALPGIRRCYEQALEQDPSIAGTIVVHFVVGTTDTASGLGQVLSARIDEASVEQTIMDDCLLDAMEALQFDPPADGEMEVRYPFTFSTG